MKEKMNLFRGGGGKQGFLVHSNTNKTNQKETKNNTDKTNQKETKNKPQKQLRRIERSGEVAQRATSLDP